MAELVDACLFIASSAGDDDFVVGSARPGWRTPAQAGAVNGGAYRYRAYSDDNSEWEIGTGVYTAGTQTLTRDVIMDSSSGGGAVNFTTVPNVALTLFAADVSTPAQRAKVDFLAVTAPTDLDSIRGKMTKVDFLTVTAPTDLDSMATKLAGVAPGATANDTDANLKARENHTGSQAISTVTGLQTALDGKVEEAGHTATSILGRSANTAGSLADINATTNDRLLARVGNIIDWVQLNIGMIPDNLITYAKIATASIATAAQFRSNAASQLLDNAGVWGGAEPVSLGSITGSQTLAFNTFINAYATVTGNITFNAVSGLKNGQSGVIELTCVAEQTLSFNTTYFASPDDAGMDLPIGRTILSYYIEQDGKVFVSLAGSHT